MNTKRQHICWPAIIRIVEDAELLAVKSAGQLNEAVWREDQGLFLPGAGSTDAESVRESCSIAPELIDSSGLAFNLHLAADESVECAHADKRYLCAEIIELVQRHAALQGRCCVAKIGAGSIAQAVLLVEQIDD